MLGLLALGMPCRAWADAAPGATGGGLHVRVAGRSLAPGELVRVVVTGERPLAAVSGTLHGEALDFVRNGGAATGAVPEWSAWAALDLDWPAGPIPLAVTARDGDGVERAAGQDVPLAAKAFPRSDLTVPEKFVNPPKSVEARIKKEQALLAEVYARRTDVAPPSTPFVRPVEGAPTSPFGARRFFNGQPRAAHPGLDLAAAEGTPVACSGPGVVALAKDLYFSGGTVIVDHGGGLFTIYAHLSRMVVKAGQRLGAGDRVGLSGHTGRVTGPHLHWGGKVGNRIFDPTSLLAPELLAIDPPSRPDGGVGASAGPAGR